MVTGRDESVIQFVVVTASVLTAPANRGPLPHSALNRESSAFVDSFAQVLARLEMWHILAGQRDSLARLGVSADTWRPKMQRKAAKSADFYTSALGQRVAHQVEKMLYRKLHILCRQVFLLSGDHFYEFRFCHLVIRYSAKDS
jgi:hypothetical protein